MHLCVFFLTNFYNFSQLKNFIQFSSYDSESYDMHMFEYVICMIMEFAGKLVLISLGRKLQIQVSIDAFEMSKMIWQGMVLMARISLVIQKVVNNLWENFYFLLHNFHCFFTLKNIFYSILFLFLLLCMFYFSSVSLYEANSTHRQCVLDRYLSF